MQYYQLLTLNFSNNGVKILGIPSSETAAIAASYKSRVGTFRSLLYFISLSNLIPVRGVIPLGSNEKDKTTKLNILNTAICNMSELSKKMLKYATPIILCLIVVGTVLFVANKISNNYSSVFEFTTTTLITNSFFVLAEFIIASFVIDIIVRKRSQ